MKIALLATLVLSITACGGGSSSTPFVAGLYNGETNSLNKSGLCQYVSQFSGYSVRVSEIPSNQTGSSLLIEKVLLTSHGIFDTGVSVTTSADNGDVSFSDFDEELESENQFFIGDSGDGTSLNITCVTMGSTVYLSSRGATIHFQADSSLSCVNNDDAENFECDITEKGELLGL